MHFNEWFGKWPGAEPGARPPPFTGSNPGAARLADHPQEFTACLLIGPESPQHAAGDHDGAGFVDAPGGHAMVFRLDHHGERVPGMNDTWRSTPLGNEIQLDLMMVFMGI